MTSSAHSLLEAILEQCAAARPGPWFPAAFAATTGTAREPLDAAVEHLRLAGLIRIVDWQPGRGQGYALTEAGEHALHNPWLLAQVQAGKAPPAIRASERPTPVRRPNTSNLERIEAARAALLSPSTPVVTILLIALNVGWFVYGAVCADRLGIPLNQYLTSSNPRVLDQEGALRGVDFLVSDDWTHWLRLLTCCFVHIGILHLLVNMYSLYVVGPLLERLWGPWRFLVLYLLAGFGGSCGMIVDQPAIRGAGASGALWGIMASMGTWLFLNRHVLPGQLVSTWTRQLWLALILNLFITFGVANISKGAHFGGGIVGLIAAIPVDYLRFGRGLQWWAALVVLMLIPIVCVVAMLWRLHTFEQQLPQLRPQAGENISPASPSVAMDQTLGSCRQLVEQYALPLVRKAPDDRSPRQVEQVLELIDSYRRRLFVLRQLLKNSPLVGSETSAMRTSRSERSIQTGQVLLRIYERLQQEEAWQPDDEEAVKQFLAHRVSQVDSLPTPAISFGTIAA